MKESYLIIAKTQNQVAKAESKPSQTDIFIADGPHMKSY